MAVQKTSQYGWPVWYLLALALGCLSMSSAYGQTATGQTATPEDATAKAGELKVGDMAPEFELKGLEGKTVKLKDFRKSATSEGKNVAVVFVRANW